MRRFESREMSQGLRRPELPGTRRAAGISGKWNKQSSRGPTGATQSAQRLIRSPPPETACRQPRVASYVLRARRHDLVPMPLPG